MKLTLTPGEITSMTVASICRETQKRGWSLMHLSEESGVPYDTVKKLVTYRIENPHLYNILRIAYALDMDLNTLLEHPKNSQDSLSSFETHSQRMVSYLTKLEESLSVCEPYRCNDYIPVFEPLGTRMVDSLSLDSYSIMTLPVDEYRKRFGSKLSCGIRISTNDYHPVYYAGDILLMGRDRAPVSGETGLFIRDNCLYLRKFLSGSFITLAPVNKLGTPLYLDSLDGFFIFGYVLTVYR